MHLPPPGMSAAEIDALLAEVARGAVSPQTAITLMTINGEPRAAATRRVFCALGGTDATETSPTGDARYVGSGKLVSEVERAMSR